MSDLKIPEFAILGHPNEGKSSVVSTLAEDDSVRIGSFPGETVKCQVFPVKIDGEEIIRFVDTPGFQNPRQTLSWMKKYTGPEELILQAFIEAHEDNPEFSDECELLGPVAGGSGIIYVVDGSRPLRNDDRAEMEILRLTARPRMSIINCKEDETAYLDQWKNEFRKHFNSIRQFNAHKATYKERLELLESLKSVDQDWQPALSRVIDAFSYDWQQRTRITSEIIVDMLAKIISFTVVGNLREGVRQSSIKEYLEKNYQKKVETIEKNAFKKIKKRFKHNIFNIDLPLGSILYEDLFSEKTWQFLGLTPREVAVAAGVAGGTAGAIIDTAAAGLTFGIFTALGSTLGAGSALLSGRRITNLKFKGVRLGRDQIRVRPARNPQFMYILLDRVLIYYSTVINWAHGRRDYSEDQETRVSAKLKKGVTAYWNQGKKKICNEFYLANYGKNQKKKDELRSLMLELIRETLDEISSNQ